MPPDGAENAESAGISVDVEELFQRLREEVRRSGSDPGAPGREPEATRGARMNIAVLRPQVPFARGGAEIFTDRLVDELRARGHEADLVSVPFKWYPGARVLTQAFLWRL